MSKNKDKFDLNATNLISFVFRKFKLLLLISLAAAIVTAIISFFIPNMYKAEVILVPTSQASVSKSLIDVNYPKGKGELTSAGEEEELDVLLQLVESSGITGKLAEKFNLMEHYEIDPKSKYPNKQLYEILSSNLKISRTEYNTVSVTVWDKDPKVAAAMANYIPVALDTIYYKMEKERLTKAYEIVKFHYDSVDALVYKYEDSIRRINKLGIADINPQELIRAKYKALLKGRTDVAEKANNEIKLISEYTIKLVRLRLNLEHNSDLKTHLSNRLMITKVAKDEKLPRKYVVNTAYPAERKDKPKRSIYVIVAFISTFFMGLFSIILLENIKKLK